MSGGPAVNVDQLKARLATEAAAAPGGSPDARARLDERIARQVRTARAAVGATGVALVIVLTIAFVNRPSADGTRVGTASRPAGSMMLRSPTPQAAACLNNGQLKAAVLEGITAGRHWILGIQGGSAGMGDHVDTMVVAFPPEHVTESCGERFGGSPLGAVAQRGWPNP